MGDSRDNSSPKAQLAQLGARLLPGLRSLGPLALATPRWASQRSHPCQPMGVRARVAVQGSPQTGEQVIEAYRATLADLVE